MQVAKTILNQMGGAGRIMAMTGAKQFGAKQNGVCFRFSNRGAGKPNFVEVTLNSLDTYDVRFCRIRGLDCKEVKTVSGIYSDMLRDVFESNTGLALSL